MTTMLRVGSLKGQSREVGMQFAMGAHKSEYLLISNEKDYDIMKGKKHLHIYLVI